MKTFFASITLLWSVASGALAQKSPVFTTQQGAIRGYDPVAYFNEHQPVPGKPELSYAWQGAEWHFATEPNLAAFKQNPEKFAPQYGGYCAYGTAEGHKAPTDPQAWTIVNGKLYLNYSKKVQQTWNQHQPQYIQSADQNWPQIKDNE